MKRDELIKKWLDNELNSEELEAFKALKDYKDLVKLSDSVQQFKAPEYNTSEALNTLLSNIKTAKPKSNNWIKPLLRIAAILVICFSAYYYTITLDTKVSTLVAQKTKVVLPDASEVNINAASNLIFNKRNWDNKRVVSLEGEAYFKVAKGSTFNVNTASGIVTVLGTEFNVKHRDGIFEVVCYEGSVGVSYLSTSLTLKPGELFLIIDGKPMFKTKQQATAPSWVNNQSRFVSLPFKYVINEFERQYNVTIETENIDTNELFTGSFTHNNIDLAIQSLTLPLNLKYNNTNNNTVIKLTRE